MSETQVLPNRTKFNQYVDNKKKDRWVRFMKSPFEKWPETGGFPKGVNV